MAANKISPIEAAITACHVRHSFPNISCNLMVGVSSAAPSNRHDIRLGDVVVGLRKDGGPSVIQYDTGIMRQDREFQHQGRLNEPAAFARAAVGATAAYSFGGISKLETDVEATLARNEKLQKDFQRPSSREDRLCRSRCEYAADDADCEDFDHPDDPVLRLPRDPENMIVVHQGTIGSGNALVRDAIHRDMLSAKFNIICLDTESAGVMNVLPSLAIRGIFNYADGCHHGRKWRNYAALAAATYARLLLQNIRVVE
ncbi:Hypothetical protein D9617_7g032150 [Elsinoe fawcettii]|nr:Hypothetical protein D9617_7g032150 [Elsinoe fawcettii]